MKQEINKEYLKQYSTKSTYARIKYINLQNKIGFHEWIFNQ